MEDMIQLIHVSKHVLVQEISKVKMTETLLLIHSRQISILLLVQLSIWERKLQSNVDITKMMKLKKWSFNALKEVLMKKLILKKKLLLRTSIFLMQELQMVPIGNSIATGFKSLLT